MEYLYLVPIFSAAIGCKINGGGVLDKLYLQNAN